VRFEAQMPNERWQADITHWKLASGAEVEILNVIDDHSRFLVASEARVVFNAADVVASFHIAAATHGFPASLLTDNGAVFTAVPRKGRCALEPETAALGIRYVHVTSSNGRGSWRRWRGRGPERTDRGAGRRAARRDLRGGRGRLRARRPVAESHLSLARRKPAMRQSRGVPPIGNMWNYRLPTPAGRRCGLGSGEGGERLPQTRTP
jgi:hypothetical protein